jgi:hypothetical protein
LHKRKVKKKAIHVTIATYTLIFTCNRLIASVLFGIISWSR